LPSNKIYVPSERSFRVEVHSYFSYRGEGVDRTLTIEDYNETTLDAGDIVEIDLRSLVLPQTIVKLQNETDTIEKLITEKEAEGFFLAMERLQLSSIKQTTIDAISLKEQSKYDEAFTKSREAFVLISDLEVGFNNMLIEALRSIYILIGFIGLTSIIITSLLFEDYQKKLVVSVSFFTILVFSLFYLHPGTQMVNRTELVKVSMLTLVSVNILALLLPRFLNRSSTGTEVSILNILIPVFSISKRSLRRRRLRFALTFTSILLLVASFISLTSFTSGYGLSFTKSSESVKKEGLMIRTPDPPPERAAASFSGGTGVTGPLPLDESLLQWYSQMEEVTEVVPRYENFPQRQYRESYTPIAQIGGTHIFGVVGIEQEQEEEINYLDSLVVKGRYLGDRIGEVLISNGLADKLDASIGDTFTLSAQEKIHELIIVGLLDDQALTELTDIDGKPFLPNKIIEWERVEMDGPDFVLEALVPCSPDEVIWVSLETGKNITSLWLQGISLLFQKDVDILKFARRLIK
jgi:hypothetical protein